MGVSYDNLWPMHLTKCFVNVCLLPNRLHQMYHPYSMTHARLTCMHAYVYQPVDPYSYIAI